MENITYIRLAYTGDSFVLEDPNAVKTSYFIEKISALEEAIADLKEKVNGLLQYDETDNNENNSN